MLEIPLQTDFTGQKETVDLVVYATDTEVHPFSNRLSARWKLQQSL